MRRLQKIIIPLIFWLAAWQLASLAVGRELWLPAPLRVGERLLVLAWTADFWLSVGATLGRVFLGLAWGTAMGTVLAFLTHFFPWADRLISPAVRVVRATPVVSFILLVYLWAPRWAVPWVIAGLMVMPVVWESLSAGLENLDGKLLEFAHAYRFSSVKILLLVYLPALRPYASTGLLTAFGLAWKSGVAAEVICPPVQAIGSRIQQARLGLETADLFAWTLTIVALSLALEGLLRRGLEGRDKT